MANKRLLTAYPLFTKDPFFSLWSKTEQLTDDVSTWYGGNRRTVGLVKANGKLYRFMGKAEGVVALEQVGVEVTAFRTIYSFTCADFDLNVSFFSPVPMSDYEILSCPVCYLEYKITPKTQLTNVEISLSLHQEWCSCKVENSQVRGDSILIDGKDIGYFGLNQQRLFDRTGDRFGANWGYYYLRADECYFHEVNDFTRLTQNLSPDTNEITRYLTGINKHAFVEVPVEGKFLVAFDDVMSINYFGKMLKGYFFEGGRTIFDAIKFAEKEYDRTCLICNEIESQIEIDSKYYSDEYRLILNAAYRQVMASHKMVKDECGKIHFLSKECGSCGCIATVDVTYPTMPIFLMYAPELLRASMEAIFEFEKMPVWEYDFAPHDAGMYPFCNGQYYGVKNKKEGRHGRAIDFYNPLGAGLDVLPQYYLYPKGSDIYNYERQMPVEESSNMIIACALYLVCGGDKKWVKDNLQTLTKWCNYLVDKGLVPENQLCTDDFLSRMDKNVNLAIKSIVAIGAFGKILELLGEGGETYIKISKERARELETTFAKFDYMPLSFDSEEGTFSMKYNLAPSLLLNLDLFTQEFIEREVDECLKRANKYGIPLDNRSLMTKLDWMMWIASLTKDVNKREKIISIIHTVLTELPDRVPFPDWLEDCAVGKFKEFTNRTVVGSMFILVLNDKLTGEIK